MSFCCLALVDSTTFILGSFCIYIYAYYLLTFVSCFGIQVPNEVLFETMDKTLHLLEMGFSNNEISMAIEKIGAQLRLTYSSSSWNVYE